MSFVTNSRVCELNTIIFNVADKGRWLGDIFFLRKHCFILADCIDSLSFVLKAGYFLANCFDSLYFVLMTVFFMSPQPKGDILFLVRIPSASASASV